MKNVMPTKLKRQLKIKEILQAQSVRSHEELAALLEEEGFSVTQATLSRDFSEMGVIRTITDDGPKYILNPEESTRQVSKLIAFEIISVQHNETVGLIRTLAGRAQGVAYHIDRLNHPAILGTVAGDDTVLVIPSSVKKLDEALEVINNLMMSQ